MAWRRDIVYGVVIAIFGLILLYATSQIPLLGDVKPVAGARYYLYPWFLLLFLLGLHLVFQGMSKKKQALKEEGNEKGEGGKSQDWFIPLPTLFTLAILLMYVTLIPVLGYQIMTFLVLWGLFMGYFLFCQKEGLSFLLRQKKAFSMAAVKYAVASAVVVALIQLIFGTILDVRLPG